MVSHLPQLISIALMHAAMAGDAEHGMLDKLAGRGFLDMTRLAASNYGMWKGILETNTEAIEESIERFKKSLSFISSSMLEDAGAIAWETGARRRRKMAPETLSRPRKQDLRTLIDRQDKQMLMVLAHRIDAARKIGKLKMYQSAPVTDPEREKRMMVQRRDWGKSLGLPEDMIDDLFAVIVKHSSRFQVSEMK